MVLALLRLDLGGSAEAVVEADVTDVALEEEAMSKGGSCWRMLELNVASGETSSKMFERMSGTWAREFETLMAHGN